MLTPLDQIANQNHLQLIKAILPYIQPQNQKLLSVMIKMLELQNILRFYKQNANCISACNTEAERPGMLDILTNIRNYCEGEEQGMIDQWIQIASAMEMYSIFAQSSDEMPPFPDITSDS